MRHADGLRLWKRYVVRHERIEDPMLLAGLKEQTVEAYERYLDLMAELFEVDRYSPETPTGLHDVELTETASRFSQWVKKKSAALDGWRTQSRTSAPPLSTSTPGTPTPSPASSSKPIACTSAQSPIGP